MKIGRHILAERRAQQSISASQPWQRDVWIERLAPLLTGLLCGLVAALTMTLVMGLLRWGPGIPPPAELAGDRIVPRLSLDQFIQLLTRFGGANGAKQFPIKVILVGQLVVGALLGIGYGAVVAFGRRDRARRRGRWFIALTIVIPWLISLALLWPVLSANYRGLPPDPAALATAAGILLSYATYVVGSALLFGAIRPETTRAGSETLDDLGASSTAPSASRRAVVTAGAGVVVALGALGVLRTLYQRSVFGYDGMQYRGPNIEPITPNERFYLVTKNVIDPRVEQPLWHLQVGGAVDMPHSYSLAELTALPSVTQQTTLECISNFIGGGLMSNAVWRGIPLRDLLSLAGPRSGIVQVAFRAVDGYTDSIPIAKALEPTTLVAWEMNGEPLPDRHGYPVRVVVPGRYGEKSVKWVTRIEPVEQVFKGFYARQGWGPTWVIQTVSRFDAPANGQVFHLAELARQPVTLKGVALAGDRGISAVEVSVDNGQSWRPTTLTYLGTHLTWAFWQHAWQPDQPGEYHLTVRATDGTGALQTTTERGITPDGATGYHRITVRVV